jgi:tetratricopeptide (TPR) repeat protein
LEELNLDSALGHLRRLPDLSRLPRLRVLHVCGSRANGPYPGNHVLATVCAVTTLEELAIDRWGEQTAYDPDTRAHEVIRPALAALPEDAFARMPMLRRLDLSFNAFTTLPASFYALTRLEFVDLRYTKLDAATLDLLRERHPRVRLDLRDVATRADSDDPGWQAVHALVAEGAAKMRSPAEAIPHFEQALAQCVPGARYSEYDQLYALYGAVDALSRLVTATGETEGDRIDALIGYAEQALELVPDPAAVWHYTDEGAFQEEVTRKTGNALAWLLMRRGEHDRALATIERALAAAQGSDHDYIRDTKVRILLAMGRPQDAYPIVDAVLTREPDFDDFADLKEAADFQQWRRANRA